MRGIVIPIAFQLIAIIFAPPVFDPTSGKQIGGFATSIACQTQIFNNINCPVPFNTGANIAFTTSGYSYTALASLQQCQSLKVGGVTYSQIPILGLLGSLPVFGSISNYFIGLGLQTQNIIQNIINPSNPIPTVTATVDACKTASSILFVLKYDAQDALLLFIGAILTAVIITALTGITVAGTGINTGAVYTVFIVTSFSLIWIILTGFAFATWNIIPAPFGSTMYGLLTLSYAISIVGVAGGSNIGGLFED